MIYVEIHVVSIFREQKAKGHVARLSNNGQNPHQISILVANSNFLTIYSRTVGLAQTAKKNISFFIHLIFLPRESSEKHFIVYYNIFKKNIFITC